MKNHVKQMCRKPLQLLLMIVLVMIVTVMLVVGGNLWVTSDRISKAYEDDFITIGTVTQKPDAVAEVEEWDAEMGDYRIRKASRYNRYTTEEDLAFPEITYLMEPEKRVYWGSYAPEYLHANDFWIYSGDDWVIVAEFSPMEDCVPNESVLIKITKILGNAKMLEGSVMWFCDHHNRYPDELKADKTYVAKIAQAPWTHGSRWEESGHLDKTLEYRPEMVTPLLYTPGGKRIEDTLEMQAIYEVTEGFYETDAGKRLLAISNMGEVYHDTQPVLGTNSTDLLLPFYEGSAWVYEGRYPTEEEYAQGSPVCLAPREFAENNGLSVGDQVMTHLYYTSSGDMAAIDYTIAGGGGYYLVLGLDGKLLSPFEEKAYTIVGLYDYTPSVQGIGREELIVPLASVENKTENYLLFRAMADGNTSFQIENGTIPDFLEASAKNGVDNLVYTFYDRGYSALMEEIQNLKNMSAALLVMGLIAAVILTLQISHIYITKQKMRFSIERMLGMSGKQCRNICMAGILILLLLGTIPGVAAGMSLADEIGAADTEEEQKDGAGQETAEQTVEKETVTEQEAFSRKYSNLGMAAETEIDLSGQERVDIRVSCMMGGLVILLGVGISTYKVRRILSGEPLYLVSGEDVL